MLFAVILCAAMAALTALQFGKRKSSPMLLKIVMPENMDYYGVFDSILQQYTFAHKLTRVKTSEFGSLFELSYEVNVKDMSQSKRFIDELRCKNGNLSVVLACAPRSEGASFC